MREAKKLCVENEVKDYKLGVESFFGDKLWKEFI